MSDIDTDDLSVSDGVDETAVQPDMFTVSVKGTGVELTRTVDQATALNVISTVLGGAVVPARQPTAAHPVNPVMESHRQTGTIGAEIAEGLDPYTTVGEYIDECQAKQFSAKITAIGHFLALRLGQDSFTREEVKSQFRPAGEAQPANFSRDFADAIAQRWIAEDPNEKGQYFVTKTGRAAIAAKFDRSSRKSTPARRRKSVAKPDTGGSDDDAGQFQGLDDDE
ncbi:hypothetical protein [Mycobacteroides abscessus]|uniref:hypothetical protein n=1 Tax=Mycobacteroides abscessus TaxID=36809 RepID=UPI000C267C2A|nr:hypothetical protein [Mycobacteroides abscessus]